MRKLNWGHGIFLTLAFFVGLMGWFMVRAINNPEELVTEEYYQEELKYQERINELANARDAGAAVAFEPAPGTLTLVFPASVKGRVITGTAQFMKPNDSRADRTEALAVDTAGRCVFDTHDWMKGVYQVHVTWTVEGVVHLTEERIDLR